VVFCKRILDAPAVRQRHPVTQIHSTASVAGATVMTEIAVPISDGNCSTIAAAGGIGLELGKLLIAICGWFHPGSRRLQCLARSGCPLSHHKWWLDAGMPIRAMTADRMAIGSLSTRRRPIQALTIGRMSPVLAVNEH
jgi:hypothetical protein